MKWGIDSAGASGLYTYVELFIINFIHNHPASVKETRTHILKLFPDLKHLMTYFYSSDIIETLQKKRYSELN